MSGRHITRQQADLYMNYRTQGLTQILSSAKSGISVRSGRDIEHGRHASSQPAKIRSYKTRVSPIDKVWEEDLEPLLRSNPDLTPRTLLTYLQKKYVDDDGTPIYGDSIERTLQRRVSTWKALHGPSKEVMFPQNHVPGHQGLSDFTHIKKDQVSIQGKPFKHMLYQFRLVYSKWVYLKVIESGESMQALSEGLQEALCALGGAPKEHRTDSLSASFKNLSSSAKEDLTKGYKALCDHYGMTPTRNNRGCKHENGSVESSHGHIKRRIRQGLILRGSCDFESVAAYEQWVHGIAKDMNQHRCKDLKTEQSCLNPLPSHKAADYEVKSVKVTSSCLILVKKIRYSVPSQLSGHTLTIHIYQRYMNIYLGSVFICRMERKYYSEEGSRHVIRYQDVIDALAKKPGAFRQCTYKEALFPNDTYRNIWKHLSESESRAFADHLMVKLLKLASDFHCEEALGAHVLDVLSRGQKIAFESIAKLFSPSPKNLQDVPCSQHVLVKYDDLM